MTVEWRKSPSGFHQWSCRRTADGVELVERWMPESEDGDPPDDEHASETEVVLRWRRANPGAVKFEQEIYGDFAIDQLQAFMLEVSIAGGI